jgi:hypothetical protein
MKLRLAVVSCALLAFAAMPAVAGAGLPRLGNTLIVPNKSIGGVALNSKPSQVTAAWGGKCEELHCVYEGAKPATGGAATAVAQLERKGESGPEKVWLIVLTAGYTEKGGETVPDFDTPLTRFKTAKGIGLGSTIAELTRAYPKAKRTPVPGGDPYFSIAGPGEKSTVFTTREKRVATVGVQLHPGG